GDSLECRDTHRPFFARFQQPRNQLLAFEALARAILLDHHVRDLVDPLIAGESASAVEAFATAANHFAFLAFARIDDLIAQMAAKPAFHLRVLLPLSFPA